MDIRPYRDDDLEGVLAAWEAALPCDAVTREEFQRRVLLDDQFDAEGLLVAHDAGGAVAGFVLGVVHRGAPIGPLAERAFITAFGVHPRAQGRGFGSALLTSAEEFAMRHGRTMMAISPYPPNYFVPGVDRERYAGGLAFLVRRGYEEFVEAIAADAPIGQFALADELRAKEAALAAEGISIAPLALDRIVEYLAFMRETMPPDWVEDARAILGRAVEGRAPRESIYVARDGGRIVGYCKFDGEHFGPFGVADSHQGRGIGSVLLARTLFEMRKQGHHAAYVLWTGERAAQGVYARLGFKITRRFAILRKKLM